MLKTLARELILPILCLSKLSRKVEERTGHRPMMSDLRESGSLEQDADLVMFLLRRQYYYPWMTSRDWQNSSSLKSAHGSNRQHQSDLPQKEVAQFANYIPVHAGRICPQGKK